MISKACLVGAYQRKLEELSAFPDIELTVLVPPRWRDERGVLELERVYTRGYDMIIQPLVLNGHFHLHFFPQLGAIIRQKRPDIVHIDEEPYNFATWQALRAAKRHGARTVFFTWQNLTRQYPPPFCWIERHVLADVDYAISGNQDAFRVWRDKGYDGPMRVIPQFGVDPDLYPFRDPPPLEDRPLAMGYCGRLVQEKGVDLLLEAAAGLNCDWSLQILGSGPYEANLRTLAADLDIAGRVHFLRPVPSSGIANYMADLDVLVLPSRTRANWKEQFGRVLIEAMACGVPVIGSDSGEIPHVIGEAGLVFRQDSVSDLRRCLLCVLDDGLRSGLARAGRARVLAHYTQAQIAAETRDVYVEMMGSSTGATAEPVS